MFGSIMKFSETSVHSFVIRLWQEEPAQLSDQAKWRGHITHVLSGKKRYIDQLNEINLFISHYLDEAKPTEKHTRIKS